VQCATATAPVFAVSRLSCALCILIHMIFIFQSFTPLAHTNTRTNTYKNINTQMENPTYEDVCSGQSGHAEVVSWQRRITSSCHCLMLVARVRQCPSLLHCCVCVSVCVCVLGCACWCIMVLLWIWCTYVHMCCTRCECVCVCVRVCVCVCVCVCVW